jgi:UDP-3-O-[3-hydroxymyristoyl] glucosamine N-acyltransferase
MGKEVSIFPLDYVGEGVKLADRVVLYPGVFLGDNAKIGEDSLVYANVSIRENCVVGKRVIIHCGVVIGGDGFGFAKDGDRLVKVPQVGNVKLEDDVEIGANVTIDRAVLGTTLIKRGAKIDNLVQLAHNVVVGEDSLLVAQVGISGSTQLGRGVVLGGQAGVAGHLCIGDNVTVGGQSGITKDLPSGVTVSGLPAIAHQQWKKAQMSFVKLPELRRRLAALEKRLVKLEERLKNA